MHIETPIYNHMLIILFVYVAFYQTFGWSVYNETPLLITTNIAMSQCQMYAILIKILNFSHIYKKIISQFNIHCTLYSSYNLEIHGAWISWYTSTKHKQKLEHTFKNTF